MQLGGLAGLTALTMGIGQEDRAGKNGQPRVSMTPAVDELPSGSNGDAAVMEL
jgi:hypothetical protein